MSEVVKFFNWLKETTEEQQFVFLTREFNVEYSERRIDRVHRRLQEVWRKIDFANRKRDALKSRLLPLQALKEKLEGYLKGSNLQITQEILLFDTYLMQRIVDLEFRIFKLSPTNLISHGHELGTWLNLLRAHHKISQVLAKEAGNGRGSNILRKGPTVSVPNREQQDSSERTTSSHSTVNKSNTWDGDRGTSNEEGLRIEPEGPTVRADK